MIDYKNAEIKLTLLLGHMTNHVRYSVTAYAFKLTTTDVDVWINMARNSNHFEEWKRVMTAANELWAQVSQDRHI